MKKRMFKPVATTALAVLLLGLFSFTTSENSETSRRYFEIAKNLEIFATLYKEVNTYYVDEVNPNELIKTGIDAMLKSLDPYTNYIPEDDIEDYRTMTTGEYGGIGSVIGRRNGKNIIIMPYKDFPAEKSGLKIADEIISIDGINVEDKNTEEVSKLLKGQANTTLEIEVKRHDQDETIHLPIKREKITLKNVPFHGMLNEDVGYIKLSDFTTGAGKEVKSALKELKEQGAQKIVLDLRGNPGGLLNEAVNVSNVFIDKGLEVVSTKGKVQDWNKTYKALNSAADTEIPLAVLTSDRSASAAEIVSGVIQDYDRGVLIGERTFGKGLVQATRPLTYNSQLKVTTAKYYIPSGRCIQAIDYSHKVNGHAEKVPDSLKTAFSTRAGRVVYDGNGIAPDMTVEREELSPIAVSLMAKGLFFDYATEYYYENKDEKVVPKTYAISDQQYDEFKEWLSDKDYDYTTNAENTLEKLQKITATGRYDENVKTQLEALETAISHNKEKDLDTYSDEVRHLLAQEIVSRHFLSEGIIEASFKEDPDIAKAIDILNDQEAYQEVLTKK
ncbi:peptidase S41 [Aureibacter tunicatorum]|nr:peptidase S41 [Aureibacter tunicatorum]